MPIHNPPPDTVGTFSGTVTTDQIAFGTALDTLGGSANLTYDSTDGEFLTYTQSASTSGTPTALTVTTGAHTGITAATEDRGIVFDLTATKTWASGAGPLAEQSEFVIQQPTYDAAGGPLVITRANTVLIDGEPLDAGGNISFTTSYALRVNSNLGYGVSTNFSGGAGATRGNYHLTDGTRSAVLTWSNGDVHFGSTSTTATFKFLTSDISRWELDADGQVLYTRGSPTALTASTESHGYHFDASANKTWAAGNVTENREVLIEAPTYTISGGASAISLATTFVVDGAPIAGTATGINGAVVAQFGDANGWTHASDEVTSLVIVPAGIPNGTGASDARTGIDVSSSLGISLGDQVATIGEISQINVNAIAYSATAARTVTTGNGIFTAAPHTGGDTDVTFSSANSLMAGDNVSYSSTAAFSYNNILSAPMTLTLTGSTGLTNDPSITGVRIGQITVTSGAALTADAAASLYIEDAPVAAGSVTLTDTHALWVAAGNSQFDGTLTMGGRIMLPMGEVSYFNTTGTAVTIAAQSDGSTNMVKIAPTTTFSGDFETDNGGANNGRLRYTGSTTKTFHVAVTLSGTPATPNDVFVFGIAKDGTVQTSSKMLGSTGGTQVVTLHGMVSLAQNEYIELYIGNTTAGRDFTVKSLNIFMMGM